MTPKLKLIAALKALCAKHGGYVAVAEKADVNAQNIYQIITGRLLESGEPRGVGPTIQKKLDLAFPGWASAADHPPSSIGQVAVAMGRAVSGLSESRRKTISILVAAQIADQPNEDEADAIHQLSEGVAVLAPPGSLWQQTAYELAEEIPEGNTRAAVQAFLAGVDGRYIEKQTALRAKSTPSKV